jgi:acyl-CoA reductase-like NAD-dependent aldehyde dehydrogenase
VSTPKLLIGSDWLDTPDKRPVVDPYTGQTIAQMPQADAAMLDRAIGVAHNTFAATRHQPPFERAAILTKVSAGIEKWRAEFVESIVSEAGKPVTLADAEVTRAVATFSFAADEARRDPGETIAIDAMAAGKGHTGYVKRFPLGVIYGITPFNFPLNLVAHKVAPCIATGNTMVLKPAPRTPLTAVLLGEVLLSAGMTPGQVNIVPCSNELAPTPIDDPRVKMVSFTGSPKVGWPIKQQAFKKKVTLELGGNAAVIVCEDADLDAAVPMIASGAFAYGGQSCISVQRVYVHDSVYDTFRDQLLAYVREKVKTGDPRDKSVINGPLIDKSAQERLLSWIHDTQSPPLCGGKAIGPSIEPTILENVDPKKPISCDEAFGPVMTLDRYTDFGKALSAVNNSPFGLQAGVFTRELARAHRAFEKLDVGGVMMNQVPTFRVENMPYGGVKDSGFGREGLRYAMEDMTEPKLLVVKG